MQITPPSQAQASAEGFNVQKAQEIAKRNPKACGVLEVAPSVWVRVDCHQYASSAKAVPHLSPRKAKLVRSHKTLWKPLNQLSQQVKSSLTARPQTALIRPGAAKPLAAAAGANGNDPPGIITAETFPGTVDHRSDGFEGPVKSQGSVGSCTAFSFSAAVDNFAIRQGRLKANDRTNAAAANHVWSQYGLPNMGACADSNIARSVTTLGAWPENNKEACKLATTTDTYQEDCGEIYGVTPSTWRQDSTIVAKYDKANAEGVYKVAYVEKYDVSPPNMEEIVGTLASGSDLWVAFKIDGYAWSNSKMKNAVIPDYTSISGGHAVVLSGYRDTPQGRQFLIHNSWGESWGDKGYGWISEAMVNKNMYYAYRIKLSGGLPNQAVTDDDCAPDELIDATTNVCALICSDDSRPNNGCKK